MAVSREKWTFSHFFIPIVKLASTVSRRRAGQEQTIKMTKSDFSKYVTSRTDYHTMVMFTAMKPERGCAICQEAASEFHILANSIRYTGSQSDLGKVFFVTVDYDTHQGDAIFEQMKLSTAPAFYIFPPTKKASKDDKLDVQKRGFQAEHMGEFRRFQRLSNVFF